MANNTQIMSRNSGASKDSSSLSRHLLRVKRDDVIHHNKTQTQNPKLPVRLQGVLFNPPHFYLRLDMETSLSLYLFLSNNLSGRIIKTDFSLFFFYGHTHSIWKFPRQRLNPSHSCSLRYRHGNAGSFNPLCQARDQTHTSTATRAPAVISLTHYATVGTQKISIEHHFAQFCSVHHGVCTLFAATGVGSLRCHP